MKKMIGVIGIVGLMLGSAVADPAPDFTLKDTKGKEHSLSDFKGKYVVLEWLNHNCPFVKKHYDSDNMQKLQTEYTEKGVIWLSIQSSRSDHPQYHDAEETDTLTAEKKASPTAVLMDPGGKVGRLYKAKTTPEIFIVDPEGEVIYHGAIDSKPSTNPKHVPDAKNYVRLTLDAALDGKEVPFSSTKPYGCSVKY